MKAVTYRQSRRFTLAAAVGAVVLVSPALVRSATIRDDVPDSLYTALGAQPQYAASGYIDVVDAGGDAFSSATLIAPDWVLTVAHGVTVNESKTAFPASEISFGQGATALTFQQAANSVAQVILDPVFNGDPTQGGDLALLQLSTPITNVAPAPIYSTALGPILGQTATIVGYGYTGTGLTGYSNATLGTRRAITNVVDAVGGQSTAGGPPGDTTYPFTTYNSQVLLTDFDQPGNPAASLMGATAPTALEGASTPGDSGGGLFLTPSNGQTYLAGVASFIGVFNNNALSPNATDGHYGDFNGYMSLATADAISLIDSHLITTSAWSNSGGGTWAGISNWSNNNPPEYMTSTANFAGAIQSASTVTLDANWTVGAVTFNNTNSYTLAAGNNGALVLDNGGSTATATITNSDGSHFIAAPVVLNSNLSISITNATDALAISGSISGGGSVTYAGKGTLTLSGANTYSGPTAITAGTLLLGSAGALPAWNSLTVGSASVAAKTQFAPAIGTVALSSLTINAGSTVDIGNNALTINFGSPANDPIATISSYLFTGYFAAGASQWSGEGLTSSAAALDPGKFAVGYVDGNINSGSAQPNQIRVMYTLAGDATLSGSVGIADLLLVAQHFGTTGNNWYDGNFNYDTQGGVGISDLLAVAQNFGQSIDSASDLANSLSVEPFSAAWHIQDTTAVPEPASVGLLVAASVGLLNRRRRTA